MKRTKTIIISRSNDYTGGGFGFTLRHFVIYPPSFSVNDILQASYSVVIDEHQQKQLEDIDEGITTTSSSSLSNILQHNPSEQQQELSSSNCPKTLSHSDNLDDNGNFQSNDTIFVKEVRFNSPAYRAGLRQGDRILSVNHQSIHGKTYSQVIALIQNTPTDLILNVMPNEDDISSLTTCQQQAPIPSQRSSSFRSTIPIMSNNNNNKTIEQKLRNLQINLAQGRTEQELAQAGIYFPPSTTSAAAAAAGTSTSNIFSNYIDSVHRALDSSKSNSPPSYQNDYIPYEYKQQSNTYNPPFFRTFDPSTAQDQTQWASSHDEDLKSPSTDSTTNDKDMKTEFVNFRKKQFESGDVENVVRDPQRESKTTKYSEKKKYENEWNRLNAVADLESVMERASHFEEVDPDKYARLKSKLPNSPPPTQDDFSLDFNPNQVNFYESQQSQLKMFKPMLNTYQSPSSFSLPRAAEINNLNYNYDARYLIQPPSTTTTTNERFPLENYSTNSSPRSGCVNLIRHDSYISAVRSAHSNEQGDFVNLHVCNQLDFVFHDETPVLRRKVNQYGLTPEQEMKQRRTSYLIATDQRMTNRGDFPASDFVRTYEQSKLRNPTATPQHQTQAIKKLKNFFGEGTPEVTHALDHRSSVSPLPSSTGGTRPKSNSYFDGSTSNPRQSIPLTTMTDNIEPSKEGILYCKTVLKEGRRAADRSWRGAWAVLRHGALFLGKEKKHGLLIPLSCDSFPINLENADVELASDYIKKPRVFKLTTANQSEFLFQAPDLQSLDEWLDVLNEHCLSGQIEHENSNLIVKKSELTQRASTSSLPPVTSNIDETQKLTPAKVKTAQRSPSLKRSPSLRFRKSQKPSINQGAQALPAMNAMNSPANVSPRRSFVKSIVKKGLRTLKSSSALLTNQMSGQIYDETSGESISSTTGSSQIFQGINFGIELEECESSSISRSIPIVVEILARLVELRGINYQGIYRNAGGITAVNWLVSELDKGSERIDFNSEKWYDIKAVASTLKTFFAKLPDSLLSSKMSSLCVESSRIENHCDRLVELKRLVIQLDDYRFETLKYLCAHFRRVASKCDVNKIDARNLAIIFGPTLIWDSKATLQSNLVDNPEKIRVVESFILYHEWFFESIEFDKIPVEINPQMPILPPIPNSSHLEPETCLNTETKPSEIIQQIVRAAKRRWSSPLFLDSLSSLNTTATTTTNTDQQASKPINISVKRNRRRDKKSDKSTTATARSRSVDSSLNDKPEQPTNPIVTSSTDSAVYSMSDISSSTSTNMKKPSQSLKDISHFFHYFTLSNEKHKSKTLTNIRQKKLRKKLTNQTFVAPVLKDDEIYERISNSSICFIDQSPVHEIDFVERTSLLKTKLNQHENLLRQLKQQIHQVDQQLLVIQDDSSANQQTTLKRRHTLNSFLDFYSNDKQNSSSSSLYALQLL